MAHSYNKHSKRYRTPQTKHGSYSTTFPGKCLKHHLGLTCLLPSRHRNLTGNLQKQTEGYFYLQKGCQGESRASHRISKTLSRAERFNPSNTGGEVMVGPCTPQSQLDLKFNSKPNSQPQGPSPENYPKPLPLPCAVLSSAHHSLL